MATVMDTVDGRLDVARAIGVIAELRAAAPILTGPPEQRRAGRARLDHLLEQYEQVTGRLAEAIARNGDDLRRRLDSLELRRIPTGEPDNSGVNGITNAAVRVRELIDEMTNGDVAAYARLVASRVASSTAEARKTLNEEVA
jgi:hypothetical protein